MNDKENIAVNQYLTFTLDKELFALDIATVREVLEYSKVTRIPRTPPYMRGVINLRGRAVPVVDLRMKFGMGETQQTVDTCSIIVELLIDNDQLIVGILADSVHEVFELDPEHIEAAPRIGTRIDTEFIKGMGKQNDQFIIILDINRVFTAEELSQIDVEKTASAA